MLLDLRPLSTPPTRGVFDALGLPTSPTPRLPAPISLNTAVQRFARATADIMRMRKDGYTELPHQRLAYDKAAAGLDQQMLSEAQGAMEATGKRIDALIVRGRVASEQDRELRHNRIAFAIAGMVLWSMLPGAVARSLPVSWNVPERIAARMLGSDMWTAGANMMAKANPERWNQIVDHERERTRTKKR